MVASAVLSPTVRHLPASSQCLAFGRFSEDGSGGGQDTKSEPGMPTSPMPLIPLLLLTICRKGKERTELRSQPEGKGNAGDDLIRTEMGGAPGSSQIPIHWPGLSLDNKQPWLEVGRQLRAESLLPHCGLWAPTSTLQL